MDCSENKQPHFVDLKRIVSSIADFIQAEQSQFTQLIMKSLELVNKQLEQQTKICFSYNGGKDSTIVLYILLTHFYMLHKDDFLAEFNKRIIVLYLDTYAQFPECTQYIDEQVALINTQLIQYKGQNLISAIRDFLNDYKEIQCFFIGIRKVDKQQAEDIQCSTPNYPRFMRITPILNYTLCDVWEFLLRFNIPYCSLYNQGFTSIGTIENTRKNVNINTAKPQIIDYLIDRGLNPSELQKLTQLNPEHSILLPVGMMETERQSR